MGKFLINIVLIADCSGYVTCEKTKEKFLRCAQSMKGPHIWDKVYWRNAPELMWETKNVRLPGLHTNTLPAYNIS